MSHGDKTGTETERASPRKRIAPDSDPWLLGAEPAGKLPAIVPLAPRPQTSRRPLWRGLVLFAMLISGLAGGYWWLHRGTGLPTGIASGNGRLEADQIDIDTKFAGRVAKLLVDEGDLVKRGQVLAVMDTSDLEATLRKGEALMRQAHHALDEAKANFAQQQTRALFAKQEFERTRALVSRGFATVELLDERRQLMVAAAAAQAAAGAKVAEAQHALDAAGHDVELYRINIADNTLVAPKEGPIEYRVANVGEVLPAGGKVFTILDASYVYMDIFLPTAEAGRVRIGSDARIVLDAYPGHVIPARVVFIASQAQFTPKTVETRDERDKLMFRMRVRIDPQRLEGRAAIVKSGLPGIAYVRTDPTVAWPANLHPSAPPRIS